MRKIFLERDDVERAIQTTNSLAQAAVLLGVSYQTFSRRAFEFGLHSDGKNIGLKGTSKPWSKPKKTLEDILENRATEQSAKLKARLYAAGLKQNRCESCGISEWNGKSLVCHLEHVNGNHKDNRLENLKILCPNCHSQTETYCRGQGKNANVAELVDA